MALILTVANMATASADKFMSGSVIKNYGKHAKVQQDLKFDKTVPLKSLLTLVS
jgi:hypothetical protein